MHNNIILKGILQDIQPSHKINDVEYCKAKLLVKCSNNNDSIINLIFKKHSLKDYKQGDSICLSGNIRSRNCEDGHTQIYVFTYFDVPQNDDLVNYFEVDGIIVNNKGIRQFNNSTQNNIFTIKNTVSDKLNNYLPCISWNNLAKFVATLKEGQRVKLTGELRSREYSKHINDTDIEYRVAHELMIKDVVLINE